MNSKRMSYKEDSDQYINVPPRRNGSPRAAPNESDRALFPTPRIESQSSLHGMDYAPGHDARNSQSGSSNDPLLLDLPRHIATTLALLRHNALEQARHEAVLAEIAAAATLRRTPHPWLPNLSPHRRDIHPQQQQQEQALRQELLWRNLSSSIPPLSSPAIPASGQSHRANPFTQEYLALPPQSSSRSTHHLLLAHRSAALEGRLPLMNAMVRGTHDPMAPASSYLLSSLRAYPLHNIAIASVEEDARHQRPVPIHTATTRTVEVPPRQSHRPLQRCATIPSTLSLPVSLARPSDPRKLTAYQCLLREQIEAFAATTVDVETYMRGRNKPITLGQVGIRCRHCAHQHPRQKGAAYFPATNYGIYQAAQNMATAHFPICKELSAAVKERLIDLKAASSAGAGRRYWSHSAAQLGLVDTTDDRGIRFARDLSEENVSDE